ncbi:unnamed protein product [Rodentolepis nana]|uniref:Uncharacterized protein n=1 Tax=Rodentolepis nana TaxID=102285 RepID=A0A3P7S018_RODNA|nr:unnamed protein product [Rodentolepis nana]
MVHYEQVRGVIKPHEPHWNFEKDCVLSDESLLGQLLTFRHLATGNKNPAFTPAVMPRAQT